MCSYIEWNLNITVPPQFYFILGQYRVILLPFPSNSTIDFTYLATCYVWRVAWEQSGVIPSNNNNKTTHLSLQLQKMSNYTNEEQNNNNTNLTKNKMERFRSTKEGNHWHHSHDKSELHSNKWASQQHATMETVQLDRIILFDLMYTDFTMGL